MPVLLARLSCRHGPAADTVNRTVRSVASAISLSSAMHETASRFTPTNGSNYSAMDLSESAANSSVQSSTSTRRQCPAQGERRTRGNRHQDHTDLFGQGEAERDSRGKADRRHDDQHADETPDQQGWRAEMPDRHAWGDGGAYGRHHREYRDERENVDQPQRYDFDHSLVALERRLHATSQKRRPINLPEDFDQVGDHPGPACLMAGADPRAVVTVEILVEQQIVPPVRIMLELLGATEHRAPVAIGQERCASDDWRSPWRPRTGSSGCQSQWDTRS